MKSFLTALFLLLVPVAATAQGVQLPALHDVTGVASDDVLNIRRDPNARSEIIGALSHLATGVEVIRLNDTGRWGLINADGGPGWVSMRYLTRDGRHDTFPAPAYCFGTEPFWSLELDRAGLVNFTPMDGAPVMMNTQARMNAAGRPDRFGLVAGGTDGTLHATIARASCNDGMSDIEYGLSIDALLRNAGGYQFWSGCCTLTR